MVNINQITYRYKKGKPLFDRLSLSLQPGHVYGLLGKNGAGKSTLLKHLCGLIFPQVGKVNVHGYDVTERLPVMLQDVYIIPEEFELPPISISTYVKHHAPFYPKFDLTQFQQYVQEFDVPLANKLSGMSHGQKKKFIISFGLATNVRLLLLDEPTNGLDIPSKSQFRKVVALALDETRSIVISTHQVRDLENLIDSIIVLENGQIIFDKSIDEVSDTLSFEENLEGIPTDEILYLEELRGRKMGIVHNRSGLETQVDLEMLFNAVVKNNLILNNKFKNHDTHI